MTNNNNSQQIANTVDTQPLVIEPQETSSTKHEQQSALSSQRQLLSLAKQFSLEGGLLPLDKQMPIADRTANRLRVVQFRKQENLEAIIKKSLTYFDSDSVSSKAEQDWFNSFLELAEGISNTTMQGLWAKILAGEIAQPGSFSLKALQAFRSMSIYDAKLFAKACSLACHSHKNNYRIISGCYQTPSIFNFFNKTRQQFINLSEFGLSFNEILLLADNGLLFKEESETGILEKSSNLQFNFNGIPLKITAKQNNCVINFYKFTPVGTELAKLISDDPEEEYLQALKSKLALYFNVS